MSNNVMIPQGLKAPSKLFASSPDERLSEGLEGGGYPIIGTQGKTFYLKYKGEKRTIVNPQPDAITKKYLPAQHLDFVLLRKNKLKSHTWYEKGYQDGLDNAPDCSSTDGIGPDDTSPKPQSHTCDVCPRHEWKMQKNGREGRECSDNMRTAILPLNLKHMTGVDIAEPVYFRIPAASLTALGQLGDMMIAAYGPDTRYSSYIIRATFKDDVKWQQFEYQVIDVLNDQWAEYVLKLREEPVAYRILGFSPEGRSLYRTRPVNQVTAQAAPAQIQQSAPTPNHAPMRQVSHAPADPPPMDNSAVGARLAAERAERIAAARSGQEPPPRTQPPMTIDATAQDVTPPQQNGAAPPWDESAPPDTEAEINDVISRMGPPGA